jgi:hypothetical protein
MKRHEERDTWTRRYADWCRKQGSTTQCSPALGVAAGIVVFAAVVYIYREVIITTIEVAALAAAGVLTFGVVLAVTISTLRWYRKRAKAMAADPSGATALATATGDADVKAISREADWLADAGSELVFDKEGNLHAKTGPVS